MHWEQDIYWVSDDHPGHAAIVTTKAFDHFVGRYQRKGSGSARFDLKDTGHWLMEERPEETMEALIAFL